MPDGPLWEVPFQTLEPAADQPLLAEHALRYAPSLALLRSAPSASSPEHALLAFVNPALPETEPGVKQVALQARDWQPLPQTEPQAGALEKSIRAGR